MGNTTISLGGGAPRFSAGATIKRLRHCLSQELGGTGAQRRELAITAQLAICELEPVAPWVGVSTVANKLPAS